MPRSLQFIVRVFGWRKRCTAKKMPANRCLLLAGRLKRSNVDGVVPSAEFDKSRAIGRGPDRFAVHPVDKLEEETVVAGSHDEETRGLVGGVAVSVDGLGRDEEEVATMYGGP